MWESRAVFRRGFFKQLWESASKRKRRRPPTCLRISIAAAFSTGRFSFLVLFSFINEFPLWKTGRVVLRIATPIGVTIGGDFRARSDGERDVCSDDVLRGLGYK